MIVEIKAPSPGESITEVEIASWLVEEGSTVTKDQEIGEIESEKATLAIVAEASGQVHILAQPGDTIKVGDVICTIDTSVEVVKDETKPSPVQEIKKEKFENEKPKLPVENDGIKITPVARNMMQENGLSVEDIINGLARIGKSEVEAVLSAGSSQFVPSVPQLTREIRREKMSNLRKKLSQRLVSVKNETAMLTTFNEIDMLNVMELRKKYQSQFIEKHGVKLGFMSFFTKAVTEALRLHPNVNSMIDGDEIVTPSYFDIGIAVQTDKGLMVPVVRNAETLSLAEIEKAIGELAAKARNNRISIDDMTGGTFTITNGGVFGSLVSTPIINPPQSGILGMHNIVERPIAVNGKVEIRPMMYVALSYDHRIIDGRDSVGFLVKVKEFIENPVKLLFGSGSAEETLLGL